MEQFVLWHRILPPAFEDDETTAAAGQWSRYVTSELENGGAAVLSSLAGTVVASFSLHDLKPAINLALRLLAEAESQPVPKGGIPIAFGIATGEVLGEKDDAGKTSGSAIDRAQMLANQARAGEVVLDVESREAASRTYLFGRTVSTSTFSLRGEAIDRSRPLLEDCRRSLRMLRAAPVPPSLRDALEPLKAAASSSETHAFYLQGPLGIGARAAVMALRDEVAPPAFLEIGAVPGGLEPLGGLRLALLKAWRALEPTRRELKRTEPGVADALKAIACAAPPRREATIHALEVTLSAILGRGLGLPWIYVDRLSAVDPATLDVLGAALSNGSAGALLCIRTAEPGLPAALRPVPHSTSIELPSLHPNEALLTAAAVLGDDADMEIAKQLVIRGGTSVLGIVEAARTMVATGDLIHDGRRFSWRGDAMELRQYLGPRALLEERFATLDSSSMRFLEVACSALPASSLQVIDVAVALDGIPEDTRKRALDALVNDGFINSQGKPESELLRRAVVQRMPPARRTEVYRFVAQALHQAEPLIGPAMAATVGAYLCEGGDVERGTHAILEAGSLAAENGYNGAAVRLAAAAVQYQPDRDTRSVASEISKSVHLPSPPASPRDPDDERPTNPAPARPRPSDQVVRALTERDHAAFDDRIDAAIAGGGDLIGAHCLRVVSYVVRRDFDAAGDALLAAKRAPAQGTGAQVRIGIASACLSLARGRAPDALIEALEALGAARASNDGPGEAAALKMVSVACLAAGLSAVAERVANVAEAVAS